MKPGLVDFRYIPNRPIYHRPPNNKRRLISPIDALMGKLGYETYRPDPILVKSEVESDSQSGSKTAKMELKNKLDYEVYRPESDLNLGNNVTHIAPLKRKYQRARSYLDGGLGKTRTEIANSCERYASHRFFAISLVFSPDPALLPIVKAAGIDPRKFNESCIRSFIPNLCSGLKWGENIEFASVVHEKPDRFERDRLHNHITLPGSVIDPLTGERKPIPYISKDDIRRSQVIADRTVEEQLDQQLGREWRLKFPEYERTYDQPEPESAPDIEPKSAPIALEKALKPAPDLFPSGSIELPEISASSDETAPILFDPNEDWAIDSFGDPEMIAELVDDLFGPEMWQPPIKPPVVSSEKPDPFLSPTTSIVQQFEATRTDESEIDDRSQTTLLPIISRTVLPARANPKRDVKVELIPHWIPESGFGTVEIFIDWTDLKTGARQESREIVYETSATLFGTQGTNIDRAIADAQVTLRSQMDSLSSTLSTDFERGMVQVFTSWFETRGLNGAPNSDQFMPDLPLDLLPFDENEISKNLDRLPKLPWAKNETENIDFGFIISNEPNETGRYSLHSLRRWVDSAGIQQVKIIKTDAVDDAKTFETATQLLWTMTQSLENDFTINPDAARAKWQGWFGSDTEELQINLNTDDTENDLSELDQDWDNDIMRDDDMPDMD